MSYTLTTQAPDAQLQSPGDVEKAGFDQIIPGEQLHKGLKARHLTMISLGGTIGTGLFLASGNSISEAGGGGALLAYVLMGLLVYFMMSSLGEMSTYMPTAGSMNTYAARFVDPALGFALGWNYWYSWATTLAVELVAAGLVMQFWLPQVPVWVWSLVVLIIVGALNLISVKSYGEAEYWFSLVKVITVVVFIIVGIAIASGSEGNGPVGFGTFEGDNGFKKGVVGILSVFLVAGFSFQGTELVGVAAGESAHPRRDVPRAIRQVFWRILLFYVTSIFLIGLLIPSDDPRLINDSGDVGVSPFTLVFQRIGIRAAADIMNAVILTVVLSAGNSSLYASSRTLFMLAEEGRAPRLFAYTNSRGVPIYALGLTVLVGALAFLCSLFGDQVVYIWMLSLAGVSGFISWIGIAISHLRFRKAYIAQNRPLKDLPYRASLYPFGPWFALALGVVVIGGQGYAAVAGSDTIAVDKLIMAYIGIPIILGLYFGYKFAKGTKIIPLLEVDLDTGRSTIIDLDDDDDIEMEEKGPLRNVRVGWKRVQRSRVGRLLNNI